MSKITKTDEQWREELGDEAYQVLRKHGTERAFTHPYNDLKEPGTFACQGCRQELFTSETKYDSGSGWPSFFAPASEQAVETQTDTSFGMKRVEVHCANCGGHLGHVFDDGPHPTGLRYCINGLSLSFKPV